MKQTGCSLRDYLYSVRLDQAALCLVGSNKSIKEVWASVGFNHASNFSHEFKRRFGMSPREYRAAAGPPVQCDGQPTSAQTDLRDHTLLNKPAPRVLVADDDVLTTTTTIGRYLHLCGYKVASAGSVASTLDEAMALCPDVALLDYHFPDGDGLECARRIRDQHPRTAIVMFSADWDLEERAGDLAAISAIWLPKICRLEDVRNTIRMVT